MGKGLGAAGHGLAGQRLAHAVDQFAVAHPLLLQPARERPLPQPELPRRLGTPRHAALHGTHQPLGHTLAQQHRLRQRGELRGGVRAVQLRQRRVGLGQGAVEHGVVEQQAIESLFEQHRCAQRVGVGGQGANLCMDELHTLGLDGAPGCPAAEAHGGRQHGFDLVRAECQAALLRVVDEPAALRARQGLEAPAVADQALVFLQLRDGAAQRGGRQHDEADHVEAARPDLAAGVQAKGGVARQIDGGAPQARDVVHWPARIGQAFLPDAGTRQQRGAGHALALGPGNHGVDPAEGHAGR